MTQEEQRIYYEKALAYAIGEYKHVSCLVDAIRICVTDIDFEEKFPVSQERYLLVEKMKASEGVQTNLRNSIRFYRAMLKANKPEPWEENEAVRKIETPCGPVRLVNQDKVSKEELGDMMHHCGQDADEHQPAGYTYKDLLGMEVVCYGGKAMMCEGCPANHYGDACVKVELVGGDYLCLAKQPAVTALDDSPKSWEDVYRENMELIRRHSIEQSEANQRLLKALKEQSEELKKPVISFDVESEEGLGDIMAEIKEKADAFMDYLDTVVTNKEQ